MENNKEKYTGKFITAFDTICDGWQCAKGEDEKPDPNLHDTELDALKELFEDSISSLEYSETVSKAKLRAMKEVLAEGDLNKMKKFLDSNPDCNYHEEFVIKADEFIFGRKAIYGKDGLQVVGQHLWEIK